jgi:uncharacterized membrane protein YhhN
MNSKYWYYLFLADLLAELCAVAAGWNQVQLFTKPLLLILLFTWFIISSKAFSPLRYYIAAALFFSWLGDIFLLLEDRGAAWFMAGLGSFLLAHIMYIVFFVRVRSLQAAPPKWNSPAIIFIGLYAVLLLGFLYPYIGNLQIPVATYAITIAIMLATALHAFNQFNRNAGRYCIAGAALFLCSDSLLAVNKFYHSFPAAGVFIMATYGLAQFAIAKGSLLYLAAEKQ